MDYSITLVTREMHYYRGFDAYGRGEPFDGHGMNDHAPAVADWQRGWNAAHYLDAANLFVGAGSPP